MVFSNISPPITIDFFLVSLFNSSNSLLRNSLSVPLYLRFLIGWEWVSFTGFIVCLDIVILYWDLGVSTIPQYRINCQIGIMYIVVKKKKPHIKNHDIVDLNNKEII